MKTSKIVSILIIVLILLVSVSEVDAQRRKGKRKRSRDKEKVENTMTLTEKIWYGANGDFQLFNGTFQVGLNPMVGYKLTKWLSAGPVLILKYSHRKYINKYVNNQVENLKSFDYGTGAFIRAKFLQQFFFQTEYNISSISNFYDNGGIIEKRREGLSQMFLGLGYHTSGEAMWGYQATILYDLLEPESSANVPISFRVGFVYNL